MRENNRNQAQYVRRNADRRRQTYRQTDTDRVVSLVVCVSRRL